MHHTPQHHLCVCGALPLDAPPPLIQSSSSGSSSSNNNIQFFQCTEFQLLLHSISTSQADAQAASIPVSEGSSAGERLLHCCLLLGLPSDLGFEDLLQFLEPFLCDIISVTLIEAKQREGMSAPPDKCSIVQFSNATQQMTFLGIYSNLHLPMRREAPPCVVMVLHHVRFVNTFTINSSSSDFNDSTAMSSSSSGRDTRLPICSICLRRLKSSESRIDGANEIALGQYLRRHSDRCLVCRLLSIDSIMLPPPPPLLQQQQQSVETQQSVVACRRCSSCHVTDNLWLCLLCGHCGCGRYTLQHAQFHYMSSCIEGCPHVYSLEVASGRIWSYAMDSFVHDEHLLSDTSVVALGDRQESYRNDLDSGSAYEFVKPASPKRDAGCSSNGSGGGSSGGGYSYNYNSPTANGPSRGGSLQDQKIASVVLRYEGILESQLADQRMHYQKQLAQETIRAANAVYSPSSTCGAVTDEDLQLFENKKIEISLIESESIAAMKANRELESRVAMIRKENDDLLKEQKKLKDQILQIIIREKEISDSGNRAVADLEDQIMDLSFYQKTANQIAGASVGVRDALSTGQIVMSPVPARQSGSGDGSSSGHGRKKN